MKNNLKLTRKIILTFFGIICLVGISYVYVTVFFTNTHVEKTTQELNANVAAHIIEEKFKDQSPFLEDGNVNTELFGDLMHDMMAVNRGIEVYLLDKSGKVLYSVVLDHAKSNAPVVKVDTKPIKKFIGKKGKEHILGDDPRVQGAKRIFSAAEYSIDGHTGYMYIILASEAYQDVTNKLSSSYFFEMGIWAIVLTLFFSLAIGFIVIRYLTRNLSKVIFAVKRFKEGDMTSRIPDNAGSDFTELRTTFNEMADSVKGNMDSIKSMENLRKELTANISHDLRSPIAVAQGYVETLQMKSDTLNSTERDQYLKIVHGSMKKLTKLVDQLFEYSKLEANQIELEKEPFRIEELVSDVIANYSGAAEKRSIELELKSEGSIPPVFADLSLVERVIQNLMDNALKFTPDNGLIQFNVSSNAKSVLFSIKDSGPGIPENQHAIIFERYVHDSSKQGTGLGLAIVKRIIELHGSTVQVRSAPNEGAFFQFSLEAYSDPILA